MTVTINKPPYDLIIVGGGPAGLTAGIYASRSRLKTCILERNALGGQILSTDRIENIPGFSPSISGHDFASRLSAQVEGSGVEILYDEGKGLKVGDDKLFTVQGEGSSYKGRTIIFAQGGEPRHLGVEGEKKFQNKGLSYCAICDGPFFQEREIAVAGGGNAAVEGSLFLTHFVKKVYLIHRRDSLRASKILQDRLLSHPKIEVFWQKVIEKIGGNERLQSLILKDTRDGVLSELKVEGLFVYIGFRPNTDFLRGEIRLSTEGFILTNELMETSIKGIFAAGDVREKSYRQVVTAMGDGAVSSLSAERYLEENK